MARFNSQSKYMKPNQVMGDQSMKTCGVHTRCGDQSIVVPKLHQVLNHDSIRLKNQVG